MRVARAVATLAIASACGACSTSAGNAGGIPPGGPDASLSSDDASDGSGAAPAEASVPEGSAPLVRRNLALYRAAYAGPPNADPSVSSSENYDLTAHLATDGDFGVVATAQYNDSPPLQEMLKAFDGATSTKYLTLHPTGWIQYAFPNGQSYAIEQYAVTSGDDNPARDPANWTLLGSNDGNAWVTLDTQTNVTFTNRLETQTFPIASPTAFAIYRFNVTANSGDSDLQFSEIALSQGGVSRVDTQAITSEWQSGAGDPQWVYVDLGGPSQVDEVKLYWDPAYATSEYRIEVSSDATTWNEVYSTSGDGGAASADGGASSADGGTSSADGGVSSSDGGSEGPGAVLADIALPPIAARYVRMYGLQSPMAASCPACASYALVEFEVYGTGGVVPTSAPLPAPQPDGSQVLSGGNWKVQRADRVPQTGAMVSQAGFDDRAWVIATVPGTVLTSYLNVGAIPDPDFGNQQLQISDAFFTADFWYRDSFTVPQSLCGKHVWLNFDGIDWKADVYFNGASLGSIDGAYIRGRFDVTASVACGGPNYVAVYIHKNDNPGFVQVKTLASAGPNGGALGLDSPTNEAAVGWDWMPTIRGRDIGIHDSVSISSSGDVSILDPFVSTVLPLPSTSPAALTLTLDLQNNSPEAVSGTLSGTITPGAVQFQQAVSLSPSERTTVSISASQAAALSIANPQLWWPNGYGPQALYSLALTFTAGGGVSDSKTVPFGIRQITSDMNNGVLTLYVNGTRIFVRGGNWGMSEAMLRLDGAGYDARVRMHQQENFTMIRNWIGMTGSDAFYDACDKYGILVWNDFWLANPGDGPNPNDDTMFLNNANDKIRRIRSHPSLALYCGRNEGDPPDPMATSLQSAVMTLDGTRPYISNSAGGTVNGGGPYSVQNPAWYFQNVGPKIHSEIGLPNVPSLESMQAMMPAADLWPIDDMWGLHDFCDSNAGASSYTNYINTSYGTATSAADYVRKAQMVNMENYKAIFEARAGAGVNGTLLWMSQSAWPSTVWQTFDYYLEGTAGYFGSMHGSEPLHILWDSSIDAIKVTNNSLQSYQNLTAEATIYNLDGTQQYVNSVSIDSAAGSVNTCFTINYPSSLSPTHFIRLRLLEGTTVLSDNFYWRGTTSLDYTALTTLPPVSVTGTAQLAVSGSTNTITATVTNPTSSVALMIRLKLLHAPSGARVLPTYYSDNYISLLAGESRQVTLEFDESALGGETPQLMVEGWNVTSSQIAISP